MKAAQEITLDHPRAEALAALALRYAKLGRIDEALAIARTITRVRKRAEVLVALAPWLTHDLIQLATGLARSIEDEYIQGDALLPRWLSATPTWDAPTRLCRPPAPSPVGDRAPT